MVETRSQRANKDHPQPTRKSTRTPANPDPTASTSASTSTSRPKMNTKAPTTTAAKRKPVAMTRNPGQSSTNVASRPAAASSRKRNRKDAENDEADEGLEQQTQGGSLLEASSRALRAAKRRKLSTPDLLATKFAAKPSTSRANLRKRKASEEEQEVDEVEPIQKRARISQRENDGIPSPAFRGLPHNLSPIHEAAPLPALDTTRDEPEAEPIKPPSPSDQGVPSSGEVSGTLIGSTTASDSQISVPKIKSRSPKLGLFVTDAGPHTTTTGASKDTDRFEITPGTPTEPDHSRSPSPLDWPDNAAPSNENSGPPTGSVDKLVLLPPRFLDPRNYSPSPAASFVSNDGAGAAGPSHDFTESQTAVALRAPEIKDLDFFSQVTNDGLDSQPPMFGSFTVLPTPPTQTSEDHSPEVSQQDALPSGPSIVVESPPPSITPFSKFVGLSPFSKLAGPSPFAALAGSGSEHFASTSAFAGPSFRKIAKLPSSASPKRPISFATSFADFGSAKKPLEGDIIKTMAQPEQTALSSELVAEAEENGSGNTEFDHSTSEPARPALKLEKVEVRTGEEEDKVLSEARVKLFIFGLSSQDRWIKRGEGILKLNASAEDPTSCRLVMREGNRLLLNVALHPTMNFKEMGNEHSRAFIAPDISSDGNPLRNFSIQLVGRKISTELFSKIEEHLDESI